MLPYVQVGERVAGDLSETWWMVAASVAASCLLSFAWLLLMRLVAGPMVWLSVLGAVSALATATTYSGLRLAAAARSTNPAVAANFLQVCTHFSSLVPRAVPTPDSPSSTSPPLQVSWTPYFLEDLLHLRDTWILLTLLLGAVLLTVLLLLVFLR